MSVSSESNRDSETKTSNNNDDNEDRVSNLPHELILKILCFLPSTDHAARTSILSKKWQFLWTDLPVLDFPNPYYTHSERFPPLFNRCLILNQSPTILWFRVHMFYNKSFASDVDVWLRFAARKNVLQIDLALPIYTASVGCYNMVHDDPTKYSWPSNTFSGNSSLEVLKLQNIEIKHCGRLLQLKALKFLSLVNVELSNDFFPDILSASPLLDLLQLVSCYGCDFLNLKSERLRKLVIEDYDYDIGLKISAPSLQSLEVLGALDIYEFSLVNMSCLVDAKICFSAENPPHQIDARYITNNAKIMDKLLGNLWHVKELSVSNWCLQMLSLLEEKTIRRPVSSCVRLTFITDFSDRDLLGVARLLPMTPLLETLVIYTYDVAILPTRLETEFLKSYDPAQEHFWASQKSYFASALESLKVVKMVDFLGIQSEIELVLFLLQNASRLEKMIIQAHTRRVISLQGCLEITQMLLSIPRCSRRAVISFT